MRASLTLHNDLAEVARVTAWAEEMATAAGLPRRTAYALQLCLEEAVTNIVTHAFAPGMRHSIEVVLRRDATGFHAEITDDGRVFDPMSHKPPAPPTDLASVPVGGLGIKLMRRFADNVTYQRCGATNRLTLSFLS